MKQLLAIVIYEYFFSVGNKKPLVSGAYYKLKFSCICEKVRKAFCLRKHKDTYTFLYKQQVKNSCLQ